MTTRTVPVPFPTIQSAVAASAAGDTVVVAAGVYNEDLSVPAGLDGLSLLGAQANVSTRRI